VALDVIEMSGMNKQTRSCRTMRPARIGRARSSTHTLLHAHRLNLMHTTRLIANNDGGQPHDSGRQARDGGVRARDGRVDVVLVSVGFDLANPLKISLTWLLNGRAGTNLVKYASMEGELTSVDEPTT
jgi:hypothetical protein